MHEFRPTFSLTRRVALQAVSWGGITLASGVIAAHKAFAALDEGQADERELIRRITGKDPTVSPRVLVQMPAVFSNGHSVPMTLSVDSPMTATDYVRQIHVIAPRNPILVVADFLFTPQSGRAVISTRIRLAETQNVLAVAQMNDGTALMARTFVEVEVNGCPSQ
jgi:sulfur-oxidizing protein SoxY